MAIAAVKVIWVSSGDKTDENEVGAYMANNYKIGEVAVWEKLENPPPRDPFQYFLI